MSTPLSLQLPAGIAKGTIETSRGAFAMLSNKGALPGDPDGGVTLLLPGFMGSKEDFLTVLAPLAEQSVHAVAMDLGGQFESSQVASQSDYSLDRFAAEVASVIATLPRRPHLVGHSFGGLVAREVVLADPLSVSTLTLLNSGPGALPSGQQMRLQLFAQVLGTSGLETVWAAKQALEESEGVEQPSDPVIRAFLTERFVSNSPESLLAMVDALCTAADRTEELAAVGPPTMVCFGTNDDAWPPDDQRRMGETLEASIVELPGLGHSPAVEDPLLTAQTLVEFWSKHN